MSAQDIEAAVSTMLTAELEDLRCAGVNFAGTIYSPILVLKSQIFSHDHDLETALLQDADSHALAKSFEALGFAKDDFCVLLSSCYDETGEKFELLPQLLKLAIASFAPRYIVVADKQAYEQLKEAYAAELQCVAEGELASLSGMQVLALGNFYAALQDPEQKRLMWQRLKQLKTESVQY